MPSGALGEMDPRMTRGLVERLNRDAERIAWRFGLRYRAIEAESARVRRRYGICYTDGTIRIRLRHAVSGRPLKYSSLVNTMCHELAHLRHFNHGARFKRFYLAVLEFARREGIYHPGEPAPAAGQAGHAPARPEAPRRKRRPGPVQLGLFADPVGTGGGGSR